MIGQIRDGSGETRQAALEEFIEGYRPALVSFLVKCKNVAETDAEDLVQDFVLNKIMNGKVLDLANGQGRFRNALRTCIQRYLVDSIRKKNRSKVVDSIEPSELNESSERQVDSIDQVWAIAVFRNALGRMRKESPFWNLFYDRVLTQPPLGYEQVILKHGFASPEKASNCLMTAKRQFNRIMEQTLLEQSLMTDEFSAAELQDEIQFLQQQLLDSQIIQEVVESLDSAGNAKTSAESNWDHSILGEQILFLDQSADSNWDKSEAAQLLNHLLDQPVDQFLAEAELSCPGTLRELLLTKNDANVDGNQQTLTVIQALKEVFNARGKSKSSELPERIDVTMTFSMISKFIVAGGEVEQITSMRRDVLTKRLGQLIEKDWIPLGLREIIHGSVVKLLA